MPFAALLTAKHVISAAFSNTHTVSVLSEHRMVISLCIPFTVMSVAVNTCYCVEFDTSLTYYTATE